MSPRAPAAKKAVSASGAARFSAPAYLLLSADPFLVRQGEREFIDALVPPDARSMSLLTLYGWEADPGEVADFLQTFSFFGGKKLLVLRDVEECGEWKKLLPYLRDPNPASCLLMTSAALKGRDHKARLAALSAVAEVVERKKPAGRFLVEWVRKRFAAEGKEAGEEVARALVDAVGSDMGTLASEVEKVGLFAGAEKKIVSAHLAVSLAGGGEGSIFGFLDAVGDRDLPEALRRGREMLEGDMRMEQLIHMLARQLRQQLRAKEMVRQGKRGVDAARELGIAWPNLQEKFAGRLARWEERDLVHALEKLSAGDLAVKRGRLPADVLLDGLLLSLLRR